MISEYEKIKHSDNGHFTIRIIDSIQLKALIIRKRYFY